jgi:zinc ribbon protein
MLIRERSRKAVLVAIGLASLVIASSVSVLAGGASSLPLVDYVSYRGYIVPVPQNWSRTYNWTQGGLTFELYLNGTVNGTPANILIDTQADSSAQETSAYLNQVAQGILQGIRSVYSDAYLNGPAQTLPLAGHLAGTFEILYRSRPIFQLYLLVVSEAHSREWSVVLTSQTFEHPTLNATFSKMVQAFAITAAAPTTTAPGPPPGIFGAAQVFGAALVIIVALVFVVAYLLRRRRAGPRPPVLPLCGRCGAPLRAGVNFCEACGYPSRGLPPSGPRST